MMARRGLLLWHVVVFLLANAKMVIAIARWLPTNQLHSECSNQFPVHRNTNHPLTVAVVVPTTATITVHQESPPTVWPFECRSTK